MTIGIVTVVENMVAYFRHPPALSNWIGRGDRDYYHDWTTFYWSWCIAFSPFVGMFIARISSGRRVPEFLLVSIPAPSFIFMVWITFFAYATMVQHLVEGYQDVVDTVEQFRPELSMFAFRAEYPLPTLTPVVGIALLKGGGLCSLHTLALATESKLMLAGEEWQNVQAYQRAGRPDPQVHAGKSCAYRREKVVLAPAGSDIHRALATAHEA